MSISENPFLKSRQYLPAVLKNIPSRGWLIEYYIRDVNDLQFKRKCVGLNTLAKRYGRNKSEFKVHANQMVAQINLQLSEGVVSLNDSAVERVNRDIIVIKTLNQDKPKVPATAFDAKTKVQKQTMILPVVPETPIEKSEMPIVVAETAILQEKKVENNSPKKVGRPAKVKEAELPRKQTPLQKVIELYLEEKERELRPATLQSYRSHCGMLNEWIKKHFPKILMSEFDKEKAVCYMDYIMKNHEVSFRTYNNYLKACRALFSWAIEKCYTEINPFEVLKTKTVHGKKRILIPDDVRKQITDYFEKNCPGMLLVSQLVYASAIRPKEIMHIKVGDVRLEERAICITSENAKNHHERMATLNSSIIEYLKNMHLERYSPDDYLLGIGYVPSKKPFGHTRFSKDWDKMRKALGLPAEMQLYSLRDTGLTNLSAAGVDAVTIMKHADHHDLSITTRYVRHQDKDLGEKVFDKLQF